MPPAVAVADMQIKTKAKCHHPPTRMARTRKTEGNECWQGHGESGTPTRCRWGCVMGRPRCRPVWRFLKRLNVALAHSPALPLPAACSRELDTCPLKVLYTEVRKTPLCTITKKRKQPNVLPLMSGYIKRGVTTQQSVLSL